MISAEDTLLHIRSVCIMQIKLAAIFNNLRIITRQEVHRLIGPECGVRC